MTKEEIYNNKIDFIINQCKFLRKYYKKGQAFDQIETELKNIKEFNAFLHRVIDQKEIEVKRYEGYRTKYYNLKNKNSLVTHKSGRDEKNRLYNIPYFPFK